MSTAFINRVLDVAFVKKGYSKNLKKRTPLDFIALWITTCGVGYIPFIPATWGSLLGLAFYLFIQYAAANFTIWSIKNNLSSVFINYSRFLFLFLAILTLFLIGVWASSRVVKLKGKKDPRIVIIDEIVGQLITFLFLPAKISWLTIIIGFFAFRFFDIVKPYPANKLENLPSGFGVMADDVMAGFYAAIFVYFWVLI